MRCCVPAPARPPCMRSPSPAQTASRCLDRPLIGGPAHRSRRGRLPRPGPPGPPCAYANLDEARVLTGLDDPVAAAQALTEAFAEVVVKLGADGAVWDRRAEGSPAPSGRQRVTVVDSTGAGDAFAAAYLAARFAGAEPAICLERARPSSPPAPCSDPAPAPPSTEVARIPPEPVQDHAEWEGHSPVMMREIRRPRPNVDRTATTGCEPPAGPIRDRSRQESGKRVSAHERRSYWFARGVRRSRPTPRPGGQRFDRHRGRQGAHASGALGAGVPARWCRPMRSSTACGARSLPHGREVPADLRAATTEHARTRTERVASAARDGGRRVPARGARRGHRRSAVRPSRGVRSAGLPRWSSGLGVGRRSARHSRCVARTGLLRVRVDDVRRQRGAPP